jgi:hypothetical protein
MTTLIGIKQELLSHTNTIAELEATMTGTVQSLEVNTYLIAGTTTTTTSPNIEVIQLD